MTKMLPHQLGSFSNPPTRDFPEKSSLTPGSRELRMTPPEGGLHVIPVPGGPWLVVTDLLTAWKSFGAYDVVISLVDPGTELPWGHPRHHIFWVNDAATLSGPGPDVLFIEALLGLDLTGASTVLFHCHGGYSRSPAAAMLWAKKLGTPLEIVDLGIHWRLANPNRLILALGEVHLGLDGCLTRMTDLRTGHRQSLLSQEAQ